MKHKDKSRPNQDDRKRNDALNKSEHDKQKKLPGEYPPQEDIMNKMNMERVGLDVENFSRSLGPENYNKPDEPVVTDPNAVLEEPTLGNVEDVEQPSAREM